MTKAIISCVALGLLLLIFCACCSQINPNSMPSNYSIHKQLSFALHEPNFNCGFVPFYLFSFNSCGIQRSVFWILVVTACWQTFNFSASCICSSCISETYLSNNAWKLLIFVPIWWFFNITIIVQTHLAIEYVPHKLLKVIGMIC